MTKRYLVLEYPERASLAVVLNHLTVIREAQGPAPVALFAESDFPTLHTKALQRRIATREREPGEGNADGTEGS
ncbi:MAG TPA: hypothetical protein VFE72_02810 [Lysobacter sp.]|nr:hypothetical protein [Lysobacter sp.]